MKELKEFENYYVTENGEVYSYKGVKPRKMKLKTRADGYIEVTLRKNKKPVSIMVHRLVAMTYLDNVENKPCVNHKDGVKSNNHFSNLEWCTYKENTEHAFETGLITRIGEGSDFCTTTENQVRLCCELLQNTSLYVTEIAERVGVGKDVVSKIKRKESWTHVSKDYILPTTRNVSGNLSESEVAAICSLLNSGKRPLHISRDLGIDRNVVNRIKYRKSYKEISKKYLH